MAEDGTNSHRTGPDEAGRFGIFGGRFVSETLMPLILELEARYEHAKTDPAFWAEMDDLCAGRLQDTAHDVDRCVMTVKQRGGSDEAHLVAWLVHRNLVDGG